MISQTTFPEFKDLAQESKKQSKKIAYVVGEYFTDDITPLAAYCLLRKGNRSMLFESVKQRQQDRYSIIAFNPFLEFTVSKGISKCKKLKKHIPEKEIVFSEEPLDYLDKLLNKYSPLPSEKLPCFIGGWVGYFSFEAIQMTEKTVKRNEVDNLNCPDIYGFFYNKVIIFDHVTKTIFIVAGIQISEGKNDLPTYYNQAIRTLKSIKKRLEVGSKKNSLKNITVKKEKVVKNIEKADYISMVKKAIEYINQGEVFQIVLSLRNQMKFPAKASISFYKHLCRVSPSPYLFHMEFNKNFKDSV